MQIISLYKTKQDIKQLEEKENFRNGTSRYIQKYFFKLKYFKIEKICPTN